jgi:uncharacterized glyoxalase superfamily protein PhnB
MLKSITANLMVTSVEDSMTFYESTLGFTEVTRVPVEDGSLQFAIIQRDGQQIMLQEKGSLIAEYPILATDAIKPSISLFIMTDSFDEVYRIVCGETDLLVEEHLTFYGTREFALVDPSGYVITIAEVDSQ